MTDLRKHLRKFKLYEDLRVAFPAMGQSSISEPDRAIASYDKPGNI
jgi:hypothetical protein